MRVNYIVAFYIGPMRQNPYYKTFLSKDKLFFLKKHLEFIKNTSIKIESTFVINNDIDEPTLKLIKEALLNSNVELVLRENTGFSYGAWCDVLHQNLEKGYDYFFLIEDDYIPCIDNFLEPFLKKCNGNVCCVCSLAHKVSHKNNKYVLPVDGEFIHPSISNGILSARHVKQIYEKYGRALRIKPGDDYDTGYINQLYYLKDYTDEGYEITDITDTHSSPYMNSASQHIIKYGNPNNPSVLKPIDA